MQNICRIYKAAQMTKNLSQTEFDKVYIVLPDWTARKVLQFLSGVWWNFTPSCEELKETY